jgi:O-antigen/teichoic acid export membrane protein
MRLREQGLARATLLNLAGMLVPVLVQLLTVPLYIKIIGIERYGVMALVWLLLGYFGFFDLGFGRAIASRMAMLSTATATARANLFWTGSILSVLTGALGGLLLYVVADRLFANVFAVPAGLLAETTAAMPLVALSLPLVTCISALSGALQGREAFGPMNFSQMTGGVLYQVFPLLAGIFISTHLPVLVAAAIAGRLITAAMLFGYCLAQVPAGRVPVLHQAEIAPLLAFGGWVTLTGLIGPLLTVFDRFVIGAVSGMAAVTAYTIPYNLVMRVAALPGAMQSALFPRFAMTGADVANSLQSRAISLINSLMTPSLVAAMLLMKPSLGCWLGTKLAASAAPVGQILLIGLWPNMLAFIPYGFLQSRGRPDLPAKFHVAELFAYAPALYFLTRHFGAAGAAWAWDARTLADAILLFGAVRLLPVLASGWFGFVLLAAAYAWAQLHAHATPVYWALSAPLVAISLVWAVIILPADIRLNLVQRLRPRGTRMTVPP